MAGSKLQPGPEWYGAHRVVAPAGVLPQQAERLDAEAPLASTELAIQVEVLNVDSASFHQLRGDVADDPGALGRRIVEIVTSRGKLHNPVTGSGGMLTGRVAEVGPDHPAAGRVEPGTPVASLVSLTLTPLRLDRIVAVHLERDQVEVEGNAILFGSGPWTRLPPEVPRDRALALLDVCGAPGQADRLVRPGQTVAVVGAGKAGMLALAAARRRQAGDGRLVAVDRDPRALDQLRAAGLCDLAVAGDATRPMALLEAWRAAAGPPADVVLDCANVSGTEHTAFLLAATGGTVCYFNMATRFGAATLGAEGLGRDVTLLMGNGFVPGHAELTFRLLAEDPGLAGLVAERFAEPRP